MAPAEAQQHALGRAQEVIAELLDELAHIRAQLPAPEAAEETDSGLAAGELRAAFAAAQRPAAPRDRRRWADVLAPGP